MRPLEKTANFNPNKADDLLWRVLAQEGLIDYEYTSMKTRPQNPINEALDDLLLPYQMDLSLFASLTHPELLDHIRRVGVPLYERSPATPEAHPA